jgi:hypothetical protein
MVKFDKDEFHGIRWFAFAEAPLHRSDPHLGRFIKKLERHRSGRSIPANFSYKTTC